MRADLGQLDLTAERVLVFKPKELKVTNKTVSRDDFGAALLHFWAQSSGVREFRSEVRTCWTLQHNQESALLLASGLFTCRRVRGFGSGGSVCCDEAHGPHSHATSDGVEHSTVRR